MKQAINKPIRAFILAAGFGTRLRPYTNDKPKPMVEVAGRSLIWRTLDKLRDFGVKEVVVNTHYLADVMVKHMEEYQKIYSDIQIHISHENEILDTGGGIKQALHYFKDDPFFVIAGDNLWVDDITPALDHLAQHWDAKCMDIITLMQPIDRMILTQGVGDYNIDDHAKAVRSKTRDGTHMWTNIRLNAAHIYNDIDAKSFSFLDLMDAAQVQGRLYALEHDGDWHHISTPKDLETVDQYFHTHETDIT